MWGSWRVPETEVELEGLLLLGLAGGTQGRGTGALGGCGVLPGHGSLDALQGYPALRTCGTGLHEKTNGGG